MRNIAINEKKLEGCWNCLQGGSDTPDVKPQASEAVFSAHFNF